MIKVFHLNHKKVDGGLLAHFTQVSDEQRGVMVADWFEQPGTYRHVADCDTGSLDVAYHITNHIDEPWWENEGVKKVTAIDERSTSVGDIMVRGSKVYAVCNFGFTEVPPIHS